MRWIFAAAFAVFLSLTPLAAHAANASGPQTEVASGSQVIAVPDGLRKAERFAVRAGGRLVVEPDGRVSEATLDMPGATRDIYLQAIARWRFEPMRVDGAPVRAETRFTLIAIGTAIAGTDRMRLGIENVWFHGSESLEGAETHEEPRQFLSPPRYPRAVAQAGYGGTVNVLVKLDAEGGVVDAGIAGVALSRGTLRNERQAVAMARAMADASVSAARGWRINDAAAIEAGSAIVPVTFHPPQQPFGDWTPQIPLDVSPLPWMLAAQAEAVALTAGGSAGSARFRLLDDVTGTAVN
jgi:hypothetical protein